MVGTAGEVTADPITSGTGLTRGAGSRGTAGQSNAAGSKMSRSFSNACKIFRIASGRLERSSSCKVPGVEALEGWTVCGIEKTAPQCCEQESTTV